MTDQLVSAIEAGDAKDRRIAELEARIVELEEELAEARSIVTELETDLHKASAAQ